jgi:putative DNA primase/helicase
MQVLENGLEGISTEQQQEIIQKLFNLNKEIISISPEDKYFKDKDFIAERLVKDILEENEIIHIEGLDYFRWNGQIWVSVDNSFLVNQCRRKLREKSNKNRIENTLYLIKAEASKNIEILNMNRNNLVLKNGTLDLTEWDNIAFNKNKFFQNDYCTIQLNANYDEDAKCPEFMKYLNTIFEGDTQRVDLIGEMIGYCLTTSTKFQKAFILYGDGSNGKSVLIDIICALINLENVCSVSMTDLIQPFERVRLKNKLVNVSTEQENAINDTSYLKKCISGDLISAQEKYKPQFTFSPFCKMIFATNKLIEMKDTSHGAYRRFITIPFNKRIRDEEQDRTLTRRIIENELDGVLQFALKGLGRLAVNDSFSKSELSEELLNEFKTENNPVQMFINEYIDITDNNEDYIASNELFDRYVDFTEENKIKPQLSSVQFAKEMKKLGFKKSDNPITINRIRQRIYYGIKFND